MPLKGNMKMSEYNKVYVYNLLKDKGYNENTIAALMGNIDVETGGSFDFQQQQDKGPGYGLFQLDPSGKLPTYREWLETNDYEDSAKSQVDFMHDSIYEGFQVPNSKGDIVDMVGEGNRTNLRNLFEEGSREEITDLFEKRWEIPKPAKAHSERRLKSALNFNGDELPSLAVSEFNNFVVDPVTETAQGLQEGVVSLYDKGMNWLGGLGGVEDAVVSNEEYYTLTPEDSQGLMATAQRIGVPYKDIVKLNQNIPDLSRVKVGQHIRVR